MRPLFRMIATIAALTAASETITARQDGRPAQATFRAGIDVTTLDVSVLDQDRHPVRGLTVADFSVSERGKTLAVRAFAQVDIPPQVPEARWVRDEGLDVVGNREPTGRVVAIVIDDASIACCGDVRAMEKVRAIAFAAVDALGPDDVAAVTATMINHATQGFTQDRQLLRASIANAAVVPGQMDFNQSGLCYCHLCPSNSLEQVTQALLSYPTRQKTLIYVSAGFPLLAAVANDVANGVPAPFSSGPADCADQILGHTIKALRNAALANIAIQTIDPNGLCTTGTASGQDAGGRDCRSFDASLRVLAENTGGRAITRNNDADLLVPTLFAESSTYYLLSVDTSESAADGRFHPIEVRVNRPGVNVRTRSGYYAPTGKERAGLSATTTAADAGIIAKSDVPLKVAAAPFLGGDGRPVIASVIAVADPALAIGQSAQEIPFEITTRAFESGSGMSVGTTTQRVTVSRTAGELRDDEIEIMSPFAIKPGRYELRISALARDGRSASVYTYATVPDFTRERLSLSGLVVSAKLTPPFGPADAFSAFLPVRPTTVRTFRLGDHVEAFLRIYQQAEKSQAPVTLRSRVIDVRDVRIDGETLQLDAEQFSGGRAVDYIYPIPIDRLDPGEFLFEVTATMGAQVVRRTVRFTVE